jgi:hypothetical protein
VKLLVLLVVCATACLAASSTASAAGVWVITTDTTLTADYQGSNVVDGPGSNTFRRNLGCTNRKLDAFDDRTGAVGVWVGNVFCRTKGI